MHRRSPQLLVSLLMAAALSWLGCNTVDTDPVTLVKDMRLVAVKAEPPFIAGPGQTVAPMGSPTTLTPLVINRGGDPGPLCYAWRLCPFAWAKDGLYKCIDPQLEVDLGTNPTAKLTALDVFKSLEKFEEVAEELGLGGLTGGGGETGDATKEQQESATGLEATVLFMIGKRSVWGGTCPKGSAEMLRDVCPTRAGCVQGYTKLTVATNALQANAPPKIDDFLLNGVHWPAGLTPTIAPVADDDPNAPSGLDEAASTRGVEVGPVFDKATMQVIKPAKDKQPPVTETLSFSWYSDNGRFRYSKTTDRVWNNRFSPLKPGEDHDDELGKSKVGATIWMVGRDSRNGVVWTSRNVIIDTNADRKAHPLCSLDNSLDGCDKVQK